MLNSEMRKLIQIVILISDTTIIVNSDTIYQTLNGIGGSFTDAFGINLKNLSAGARENLLR